MALFLSGLERAICLKCTLFRGSTSINKEFVMELNEKNIRYQLSSSSYLLASLLLLASSNLLAEDTDLDTIADSIDNCVTVANTDQRDTDGDGIGNICDGDLDNSGFVNSIDFSMFKQRLLSRDPDADLDGNGIVNSIDFSLFKTLLLKEPGPSNTLAEPSFIQAPPPASEVSLFSLDQPKSDGRNAVIMMTFEGVTGLDSVISTNFEGKTVAINDLGELPDQESGDGIYSAFLNFDFDKQNEQESAFEDRLAKTEVTNVAQFSGRAFINSKAFSQSAAAQPVFLEPISLIDGTVIRQFTPKFDFVPTIPVTHDENRSLMITSGNVIADSSRTFDLCDVDGDGSLGSVNGAWSFKTLMSNMSGSVSPQDFTHNWLRQWMETQSVNSFDIDPRTKIQDFFPGWDGVYASSLDMDQLPFRLLAIVNRIDLAKTSAYGVTGNPGEIRFVFGLVDPKSSSCASGNTGSTRQMTAIFEYGDVSSACTSLQDRANQWVNLSSLVLGSPAYNAALQAITDDVTLPNAVPSKPNGSALNQLRTNEIALSFPWQLREFVISAATSNLISTTIKQTPDPDLFRIGSATMASYMEQNAEAILCENHSIPLNFNGQPFLGSHANYGFGTIWNAPTDPTKLPPVFPGCHQSNANLGIPTVKGEVRHKLSLNTCDDCHSGETSTVFTHVKPGTFPAALSGFLTGITVFDPGGGVVSRHFDDLLRRGQALESLAVKSCASDIFIASKFDPFVIDPAIDPVFKFDPPTFDPNLVDFNRLQQHSTFVH